MAELPSGTVTFLFTDIEGSTRLLSRLGQDHYGELLAEHTRILRSAFAAHGGQVVDTQGDSFFVAFRSARDAVSAALLVQRDLAAHEWPGGVKVEVRMGLHSAEPKAGGERYVGIGVHRAARIGSAAHGGQVLLSDATRALVEDDLPEGSLRDLPAVRLKDIERPERVSQLAANGLQREFPPLRGAEKLAATPVLRRRSLWAAVLAGVVAAAIAIPVFALGGGANTGGSVRLARIAANSVGAIDASSGRLLASSPADSIPGALVADRGSVWVTNPDNDRVVRIDARSHVKTQTIPVGNDPSGIAVGGGFVWVANALSGNVSKIDPNASGGAVVDTFPVGNGPTGVTFGAGRLWVANAADRTVSEIRPGSHKTLRRFPVALGADAVTFGYGSVWVLSAGADSVTRIDAKSGTALPPIGVGHDASAITVGAGAIWVANRLDGTLSKIDPGGGSAPQVIPIGGSPSSVAADGSSVWASDERAGTLSRLDVSTKTVRRVTTGNRPEELALTNGTLYVSVRASAFAHRGGTVKALGFSAADFPSVDPAVVYRSGLWSALIYTNDGLVTFRHAGGSSGLQLVPDLATSLPAPTEGGRTYTFQIRSGIHYSTGALVQPADFRRAIERTVALKGGPTFFAGIVGAAGCAKRPRHCDLSAGITANRAAGTVTFHLRASDPDFLYKLALPAAFAVPGNTPLHARLPLPATGPYMIKSFDPKHGLRLVRNARFHEWSLDAQPSGYPDGIVLKWDGSPGALDAVKRNAADDVSVGPHKASMLRRDGYGSQLHVEPALGVEYFFLNARVAPFNDVRVRRAINYAVDRNELVALDERDGLAQTTCQVLPPNLVGYVRYCPYPHDLVKAKRLVAASGTAGEQVTVWSPKFREAESASVVAAMRSLGYRARLKVVGGPGVGKGLNTYFAAVGLLPRSLQVGFSGWAADYPSADNFFSPLLTCDSHQPRSTANFGGFCSRRIDSEIAAARALQTSDPQRAALLWSKVDHDVVDQAAWVAYANALSEDFVSKRVGNYEYHWQWGPLLDQLWVR